MIIRICCITITKAKVTLTIKVPKKKHNGNNCNNYSNSNSDNNSNSNTSIHNANNVQRSGNHIKKTLNSEMDTIGLIIQQVNFLRKVRAIQFPSKINDWLNRW